MWAGLLLEHRGKYAEDVARQVERLAEISKRLRKERELSFYGDIDFIPTEEYRLEDANFIVEIARKVIP
jgi:HEPN domain-containing protein